MQKQCKRWIRPLRLKERQNKDGHSIQEKMDSIPLLLTHLMKMTIHREVRRIYIQSLLVCLISDNKMQLCTKTCTKPTVTPTQNICLKSHFRGPVTFTHVFELLAECQESLPLKKTYVCYRVLNSRPLSREGQRLFRLCHICSKFGDLTC